jgi:hypothetical protein
MMKNWILFSLFFLLKITYAQVGINTVKPTETLDVNGKLRLRNLPINNQVSYLVSTDTSNVIHKIDKGLFINSIEEVSVTVQPGESVIVSNSLNFDQTSIVISSKNNCGKYMITSFLTYNDAISFINGIARHVIASSSLIAIPSNNYSQYAPIWVIKFSNVTGCSGGNGTQFDFTLTKNGPYDYQITNDGNVERKYDFSFLKLF